MFIIRNECLLLKEHSNSAYAVGPFFCPTVLLDNCNEDVVSNLLTRVIYFPSLTYF